MRALVVLCVLGVPAIAAADLRSLTHTYEYSTQSQGTTSIQLWHTGRRVASVVESENVLHAINVASARLKLRKSVSLHAVLPVWAALRG